MKRLLFAFVFVLGALVTGAKEVPMQVAKDFAIKYMAVNGKNGIKSSEISVFQKGDVAYTYIVNFAPEGWALVSADDRVQSVIAYSHTGKFDTVGIKELPFYYWFENYANQIKSVIKTKSTYVHPSWNAQNSSAKGVKAVEPLINVTWDQGAGWNQSCPVDTRGPGGRVYAGCVAVAMAQCMSVYKHPTTGYGLKQYTHSVYGSQSANFGSTTYNWDLMSNTSANEHVALLLYHLGVSVSMNYGYDGSGAYSSNVPAAISSYFDYSSKSKYIKKSNYTDTEWQDILVEELQNGRPVYYSGDDGSSGHAFNIDGVNSQGAFHFNWGWSGGYNGYFVLSSLNPGTHNFTQNQGAVIGFAPRDHKPYGITISNTSVKENLPVNSVVGYLVALDETPDDTHTFEIVSPPDFFGNPSTVPFTVGSNNTMVTTEVLRYSIINMYEIIVKVTDKTGYKYEQNFVVNVLKNSPNSVETDNLVNFKLSHENGIVNFSFNNSFDGRFAVKVYDILGKQILTQHYTKNSGEFSDAVNLKGNFKGMYMIVFEFNDKRVTRKVILN